jgi:hypothetical protein
MPIINSKSDFLKELKNYICENNVLKDFSDNIIIDEIDPLGKTEIKLDISSYNQSEKLFFLKINNLSTHNLECISNKKHCDGIVLKVENKSIDCHIFELKRSIRFQNKKGNSKNTSLLSANMQLQSAYRFISYFQFEKCFEIEYYFYIGYENDVPKEDISFLNTITPKDKFAKKVYDNWINNKNSIPIQIPFCSYQLFNFQKIKFNESIAI